MLSATCSYFHYSVASVDRILCSSVQCFKRLSEHFCCAELHNTCRRVRLTPKGAICLRLKLTDDGEDERVGEVLVQRQLHHVPAKLQETSGLGQTDENVNSVKENRVYVHPDSHINGFYMKMPWEVGLFCLHEGYPPHDAGVDEGETQIGHQGNRPVETLQREDRSECERWEMSASRLLHLVFVCFHNTAEPTKRLSSLLIKIKTKSLLDKESSVRIIVITRLPPRHRIPA